MTSHESGRSCAEDLKDNRPRYWQKITKLPGWKRRDLGIPAYGAVCGGLPLGVGCGSWRAEAHPAARSEGCKPAAGALGYVSHQQRYSGKA